MTYWIHFCFAGLLLEGLLFAGKPELSFSELFNCDVSSYTEKKIYDLIQERQNEIHSTREAWRPFIESEYKRNLFFSSIFENGKLALAPEGTSGTYFLYDNNNSPLFVIKPTDEGICCLNNPRSFACPLIERTYWPKKDIPPCSSAQREALCYEIAQLCNIGSSTPETFLSILFHQDFHLLHEPLFQEQDALMGKEKLCSVQIYLEESVNLRSLLALFLSKGFNEKEIEEQFDQESFEDLSLFLWIIYDNDSHPSNFRAYKKSNDSENVSYGIQKIDNGLSFPESNAHSPDFLTCFPNARKNLSKKTQFQIKNLPLEKIKESLHRFRLSNSLPALEKRVTVLNELAKRPNITYHEVGLNLSLLE